MDLFSVAVMLLILVTIVLLLHRVDDFIVLSLNAYLVIGDEALFYFVLFVYIQLKCIQ